MDKPDLGGKRAAIERYSLADLIDLFSEPHVFLRELVQNAIDAQVLAEVNEPIDITTEFDPYEETEQRPLDLDRGIFVLQVIDHGTGMSQHDINSKLTQLFNTTKRRDERMIGSSGFGFLSVFAFQPDAVILSTGRDGKALKVIFKANAKFDRVPLDYEFTGTKVSVVKELGRRDLELLRLEMRSTLNHWCKMATTEIRFDGELVNERFEYGDALTWFREGQNETIGRLAVRPRATEDRHYEFYRYGILVEAGSDDELSLPGVTYRVDSPLVRSTPTREGLERGQKLDRLLQEVRHLVQRDYISHLIKSIQASPADNAWLVLSRYLPTISSELARIPILPAADGSKLSLLELARSVRGNRLLWSPIPGPERNVLWDGKSPGLRHLLTKLNRVRGSWARKIVNRLYPARDVELVEASPPLKS